MHGGCDAGVMVEVACAAVDQRGIRLTHHPMRNFFGNMIEIRWASIRKMWHWKVAHHVQGIELRRPRGYARLTIRSFVFRGYNLKEWWLPWLALRLSFPPVSILLQLYGFLVSAPLSDGGAGAQLAARRRVGSLSMRTPPLESKCAQAETFTRFFASIRISLQP